MNKKAIVFGLLFEDGLRAPGIRHVLVFGEDHLGDGQARVCQMVHDDAFAEVEVDARLEMRVHRIASDEDRQHRQRPDHTHERTALS